MEDAWTSSGSSIYVDIKSEVSENTHDGAVADSSNPRTSLLNPNLVVDRCVNTTANEFKYTDHCKLQQLPKRLAMALLCA